MWLKCCLLSQVSVYRTLAVEIDRLDEQITITELHKSGRKRRRDSNIVLGLTSEYIVPKENWLNQGSLARDLLKLIEANLRVHSYR